MDGPAVAVHVESVTRYVQDKFWIKSASGKGNASRSRLEQFRLCFRGWQGDGKSGNTAVAVMTFAVTTFNGKIRYVTFNTHRRSVPMFLLPYSTLVSEQKSIR